MADTSLMRIQLNVLIWQTSNLWQSKVRHKLKRSEITLNEYSEDNLFITGKKHK